MKPEGGGGRGYSDLLRDPTVPITFEFPAPLGETLHCLAVVITVCIVLQCIVFPCCD